MRWVISSARRGSVLRIEQDVRRGEARRGLARPGEAWRGVGRGDV